MQICSILSSAVERIYSITKGENHFEIYIKIHTSMWQILFLRICYSKSAPCEHSRIVPQNQNLYYKYSKGFPLRVKQLCVKTSVWHHVLLNIRKMLSGHVEISDPLNYTVLTAVYTSLYLANRAAATKCY